MNTNRPTNVMLTRRALCCLLLVVSLCAGRQQVATLRAAPGTNGHWHTFSAENGLTGSVVQAIWQDPAGRMWFGTEGGVSRYDGRHWQRFGTADGLLDNNVWSVSGDATSIWCATSSGVSVLRDGHWRGYTVADGLPSNDVRAVLVAADGAVWAGTFGRGIARLAPGTAHWQPIDLGSFDEARGVFVQNIWQSAAGDLWFSTNSIGALRLRNGVLDQFSFRLGSRNTVWSVGGTDDGAVWLATLRGIVQVDTDDRTNLVSDVVHGVPISDTEVLAAAGDQHSGVWFGTRAHGVFQRDKGGWHQFTSDVLGGTYVQAVFVDRNERVWFGTRGGGVTVFDPQPLSSAALRASVTVVDVQTNAVIPLSAAPFDHSSNNLRFIFALDQPWLPPQDVTVRYWLSRSNALVAPPRTLRGAASNEDARSEPLIDLRPGSYRLHVVVEASGVVGHEQEYSFAIGSAPPAFGADTLTVIADGRAVERGLALAPSLFDDTRQVRLAFAASDDATPASQLRYQYRVASESAWQPAQGADATIALRQGSYNIEVEAIDSDGNHSAPLFVELIVPAPLWKTLLWYLLLALVPSGLGGVGGALLYRRWARRQALRRAVHGYVIPYDVGPLITAPDRYIGRQHVLDTVLGKLANNNFYIYGEKRIGKTSLLLQLKQRLVQRNGFDTERVYLPVFRNIQDLPQERFWLYLTRSVAAAVDGAPVGLRALDEQPDEYDDLDAESDVQRIVDYLGRQHGGRQPCIVLLLDEVDTLQTYAPAVLQRFRAFCQHMQMSLRVVLTGVLPPGDDHSDTSPWYNIFDRIALGPLEPPDVVRLIRSYNNNPYEYAVDAETAIVHLGDGKPFETQWLCSEAVKAMLQACRTRVELADVEAAAAVVLRERTGEYATVWQRFARDPHAPILMKGDRVAFDDGDLAALLAAGVVVSTRDGYRLTTLFRRWLAQGNGQHTDRALTSVA